MRFGRATALVGVVGIFLTQMACPLEPDPQPVEDCKPQEVQCLGDGDRIRTCTDDGIWGPAETFVCVAGECMIMGNVAVCM